MSTKDLLIRGTMAVVVTALFAAPGPAQTEDIVARPFMIMTAPVQLSGRPIGIEAKYSYGSRDLTNSAPMQFVHIPSGTRLQVALVSPINPKATAMGGSIQARVAENVQLEGGAIIPRGTLVVGHVNSASSGLEIMFDQMQLSNGTILPISSNVVAGLTDAQKLPQTGGVFLRKDSAALPAGQLLELQLRNPAQVAVNGRVL